eukprot:6189731-Pleurochrysis_carterae.AAC.1
MERPSSKQVSNTSMALRSPCCKACPVCVPISRRLHSRRRTFSEILGVELTEEHWNAKCVGSQPRLLLEQNLPPGRLEALNETLDGLLVRRSELFIRYVEQGKLQPTGGAQVRLTRTCLMRARLICTVDARAAGSHGRCAR